MEKSSWDKPDNDGFDCLLLFKGRKRTDLIAAYFEAHKLSIDLIVSSLVVRAYETTKIIAKEVKCQLITHKDLYPGNRSHVFEMIFSQSDKHESLGHNPTVTSVVHDLNNSAIEWLPSLGLAMVSFDINAWVQIPEATINSSNIITLKMLV